MPVSIVRHRLHRGLIAATLVVAAATALKAQCPNGTPEPCEPARTVAPRFVSPPLDERMWIVVPFDNASHGAETEWLRDASVNLLYLDLSRWKDIRVVDDKRVADYLRLVPGAGASSKLSLNDGLAVARRAGAGRLVMGDVLKVGSRTMVTATVFDVRRGTRLRSSRDETSVQDSLIPMFGRLARGILAVAPPAGTTLGAVGTSSVNAFQEYLSGVQALNRFEMPLARRHLERALQLDTSFALAHYKLAVASSYDDVNAAARVAVVNVSDTATMQKVMSSYLAADAVNLSRVVDDPSRLVHAAAAARMSAGLPGRERTLITGLVALARGDFPRACDLYSGLVRADSSDVEALYGLGRCLYQDAQVEPVGADTTHLRFRTSWNAALRVMRSAVRIDPSFHLAFDDVVSMLSTPVRLGCRRPESATPCSEVGADGYRAVVRRNADSLAIVPVPTESRALSIQAAEAERTRSRVGNLEEARLAAEEWVASAPREWRAHKTLTHVLLRLGRLDQATGEMSETLSDPASRGDPAVASLRMNLLLRRHRAGELIPLLDTLLVTWPMGFARASVSAWNTMTGRMGVYDFFGGTILRALGLPAPTVSYGLQATRLTLGVTDDSTVAAEGVVLAAMFPGRCNAQCVGLLLPSLRFGLRLPRARWPVLDSAGSFSRVAPALALSHGDPVGLRLAARRLDSLSRLIALSGALEDGTSAVAADALLLAGDSLGALNAVRRMLDSTLMVTPFERLLPGAGLQIMGMFWPRGMLQRAELAAALNFKAEARLWYGHFIDLWAKADPVFQPLVERARRQQRAMGGS